MSPQPREWFAETGDESILRLLDPLIEGKPDLAPAEIWREALGQDPRLAPPPVLERQADQRCDDWVERYRADAERQGLPTRPDEGWRTTAFRRCEPAGRLASEGRG